MLNINRIKSSLFNLICCGLLSIGLLHSIQAKKISEEEKKLVIAELQDCLKQNVFWLNNMPKYHKIEDIASKVGVAWKMAKKNNWPGLPLYNILGHNNEFLWKVAARIDSREEFKLAINMILSSLCSHFSISDIKDDIEKKLINYPNLGMKFRKEATLDSIQPYVVMHVAKRGYMHEEGIKPNDVFFLSSPSRVLFRQNISPQGKWEQELTMEFHRDGAFLKDITLQFPTRKIAEINKTLPDYEADDNTIEELQNQYQTMPLEYTYLSVPSFDNAYPGTEIAATFKVLEASPDQKNLIIDLRDNGGGDTFNLQHLLSYFIEPGRPYGVSVTKEAWNAFCETDTYQQHIKGVNGPKQFTSHDLYKDLLNYILEYYPKLQECVLKNKNTKNHYRFTGNIAILVNEETASCAENFAIALKDLFKERCITIGGKTAGQLLITYLPCYVGSFKISYPFRDYISIGGTHVESKGIKPDISLQESADTQEYLQEALEWFRSQS